MNKTPIFAISSTVPPQNSYARASELDAGQDGLGDESANANAPEGHLPVIFNAASGRRSPSRGIFAAASLMVFKSAAVSSTVTAPGFSSRRLSFFVPGIGTSQGSCASSQASAICAGVAFFRDANGLDQIDQSDVGFQGFRSETGNGAVLDIRSVT